MIIKVINFINDYSGFLTFFIAFFTFGALIWYAWETRKMSKKTGESVEITKDKERTDRVLDIIESFNEKRFENLLNIKDEYTSNLYILTKDITHINKQFSKDFPEVLKEIKYFINYFDTVALLKYENKLNEKIFREKLEDLLLIFISAFEIQIKECGSYSKNLIPKMKHKYFFKLCIEILEKNINRNFKDKFLSENVLPKLLERYKGYVNDIDIQK